MSWNIDIDVEDNKMYVRHKKGVWSPTMKEVGIIRSMVEESTLQGDYVVYWHPSEDKIKIGSKGVEMPTGKWEVCVKELEQIEKYIEAGEERELNVH